MSLALAQPQAEVLPALVQSVPESDSDSGMSSPVEEIVTETVDNKEKLQDSDDDEDIAVHRKPHRNAIRDSDSEEEEAAADKSVCMAEALVLSASSGDEAEADEGKARGPQRSRRISQALVDSDDSGPELEKREDVQEQQQKEGRGVTLNKEQKKREKSQRHREKKGET